MSEPSNFDRRVRYCVLRSLVKGMREKGLLDLREYYLVLSSLSRKYCGCLPEGDSRMEGGSM